MTLCIAAVSHRDNQIAVATDLMLSLSDLSMSVETLVSKGEPISPSRRWLALFAGDPTVWSDVLNFTQERLRADGADNTVAQVTTVVEAALDSALKQKIEREILGTLGIDRETFWKRGRRNLGPEHFDQLAHEVRRASLATDVLLAGFEDNTAPRIVCVTDRERIHCERLGFHAIGSGSQMATGLLYSRYNQTLTIDEVLYRVCEAKYVGESALGVGKETVVIHMMPDGSYRWIHPTEMGPLRAVLDFEAKRPVPAEGIPAIREKMKEMTWRRFPKRTLN